MHSIRKLDIQKFKEHKRRYMDETGILVIVIYVIIIVTSLVGIWCICFQPIMHREHIFQQNYGSMQENKI